jgi:hypothetical protein
VGERVVWTAKQAKGHERREMLSWPLSLYALCDSVLQPRPQVIEVQAEGELHAVAGAIAQKAPQHVSEVALDDDRLADPYLHPIFTLCPLTDPQIWYIIESS